MQEENKGKNELVKINFSSKEELMDYICNVEKDEKQAEAMRMIFDESSNKHIFITGMPGTGKTTFIKRIRKFLKNHISLAYNMASAFNFGSASFRTFFSIQSLKYYPEFNEEGFVNYDNINLGKIKTKVIRKLNYILIDDISRFRPDTLDKIAKIIRSVRNSNEPFGGVRLIMVGDLHQIQPILYYDDPVLKYYDTIYFFSSKALMASGFNVVTFDKIYRGNDDRIIGILKDMWNGELSEKSIDLLNLLNNNTEYEESIHIYPYSDISDMVNEKMFMNDPNKSSFFLSLSDYEGYAKGPFIEDLFIKIGPRFVITNSGDGYRAGDVGVVKYIKNEILSESFNGYVEMLLDKSSELVNVYKDGWSEFGYKVKGGVICPYRKNSVIQFPIKIGYGVSVFELYDMEFDSVNICMKFPFDFWKLYMSLSRCLSFDKTYIGGEIKYDDFKFDKDILDFYNKIKSNNGIFSPVSIQEIKSKIGDVVNNTNKIHDNKNRKINKSKEKIKKIKARPKIVKISSLFLQRK